MVTLKTINDKFTIEEWQTLNTAKGKKSWHDFILEKCSPSKKKHDPFNVDFDLDKETSW